jgi:hypothetical protein
MRVLNWDKSLSAVAHQWDRDKDLNDHLKKVRKGYENKFNTALLSHSSAQQAEYYQPNDSTVSRTYPPPAKDETHPIITPTFGQHRSDVDAIFALAEGYDLKIYVLFIESLKETGYTGDLVLSVSALDQLKPGLEEYLRSHHKKQGEDGLNVVAYTVTWTCYEGDGVTVAKGANEGVRKCQLVGMYGDENNDPVEDPFEPRPVATARYELYWAWSLMYDKHSWLMLIDSRDTYFQSNPFANVERERDGDKPDGLLYFFEVSMGLNIGQVWHDSILEY